MLRNPDALAGGSALACLAGLVTLDAPVAPSVILPLLMYAGLRLLGIGDDVSGILARARRWMTRASPLAGCLRSARILRSRVGEADDHDVAVRLRRILDCIDRSLIAIQEDGQEDAAAHVLPLIETTNQILGAYLRLVRRELASEASRAAFLENLETLEKALDHVWFQLNREAIVKMGMMSAMIDLQTIPSYGTLISRTAPQRKWKNILSTVSTYSGRQS